MTAPADPMLALPGLDEPERKPAKLEDAVRRTLAALQAENLIEERHAARLQLAIELSQIITLKRTTGRVSTVANDARVLMELLDKILPDATGVDGALREAMERWSEAVERSERAGDPGSEVRDSA